MTFSEIPRRGYLPEFCEDVIERREWIISDVILFTVFQQIVFGEHQVRILHTAPVRESIADVDYDVIGTGSRQNLVALTVRAFRAVRLVREHDGNLTGIEADAVGIERYAGQSVRFQNFSYVKIESVTEYGNIDPLLHTEGMELLEGGIHLT